MMGARDRSVTIRGQVFASVRAAAEHFGVQPQTVRLARRTGRLDTIGFGRGWRLPMPVRIREMLFPDTAAAAAHFGVKPAVIRDAIRRGRIDRVGLARVHEGPGAKPVIIAGMRFASQSAASRALGLCPNFISHMRRKGVAASRETFLGAVARLRARIEAAEAARRAALEEAELKQQAAGQPARAGAGCRQGRAA